MSGLISINSALCLSASDIEALSKGRMIAALSRTFVNTVQHFALCPIEEPKTNSEIAIKLWAKLEFCKIYTDPEEVDKLAQLTIWSNEELQKVLQERYKLFLLCLRVFQAPKPIEISTDRLSLSKIGSFIRLPNYLLIDKAVPRLSEDFFNKRKNQLISLEMPLHPELEKLQEAVAQLPGCNAERFSQYVQSFLGWVDSSFTYQVNSELEWVKKISMLGDRSIEQITGDKSHYQAGTDFEIIVRNSLKSIGFQVEEVHQGGAGGIDVFCSHPYPLICECKCGKGIPGSTAYELDKLADVHFEKNLENVVKLIIGSGKPTPQLNTVAQRRGISIINPMTLQKLVELQVEYSGCVDLIKLKSYLVAGQTDREIEQYIEDVLQEIRLRAHLVKLVDNYLKNTGLQDAGIDALHGAYFGSNPPKSLRQDDLFELLIELSSPLTGYLGRRKGNDGRDRFYFLRHMPDIAEK